MTMQCKWTLTKRFGILQNTYVGACNYLSVHRMCCLNLPNFTEKHLCNKLSPWWFFVAIGTLCFYLACCQRLDNLVLYPT